MNKRLILYILGLLLVVVTVTMALPLLVAVLYHEPECILSFAIAIGAGLLLGLPMVLQKPRDRMLYAREGYVAVALSWILISLVGALPFTISGAIPTIWTRCSRRYPALPPPAPVS